MDGPGVLELGDGEFEGKVLAVPAAAHHLAQTASVSQLAGSMVFGSQIKNINDGLMVSTGGTLELNSFSYQGTGSTGQLADYGARRVLNGGTITITDRMHIRDTKEKTQTR
jgi:hypothetical protein